MDPTAFAPSCPWCGIRVGCHIPAQPDAPAVPFAGSASICLHCAHASIFDHGPFGLILRFPTEDEWAELRADEEFMSRLEGVQQARRRPKG